MAAGEIVNDADPPSRFLLYYHPHARELASSFSGVLELVESLHPPRDVTGFHLWTSGDYLELRRGGERKGLYVAVADVERRAKQASELLRACVAGRRHLQVLDAMAGFGVDGLAMASRGHAVTLVERHPAVHALQRDLARRCGIVGIECRCTDGFDILHRGSAFDVVYLDPMFGAHRTGALPGKRLQWLAELAAPDQRPLTEWIEAAVARARMRVVLKRRLKDPGVHAPDWQIRGRTVRYDVYRGRAGGDQVSCRTA